MPSHSHGVGASSVIKVAHVITGLDADGAETVLHQITSRMDRSQFQNEVICMIEPGPMAARLEASGVPVRSLGMQRGSANPFQVLRLARWIRNARPNVVQTWMYHADLLGGVAARIAGKPVVWGIHHTSLEPGQNKRLTIWTARMCSWLSGWLPKRIVCCSEASRVAHAQFGYADRKMEVVPNGFDLRRFHPDAEARKSLRQELGVSEETPLIGMAARFHVQKGHRNFVEAATKLHARVSNARFVLCGKGVDAANNDLTAWIKQGGDSLFNAFHLLGARADMPRIFAGLDIATSASLSEAFPMAVGEAMACATPCAVTNVGDSAMIVGETGKVVPAENPQALADAWEALLASGSVARKQLGQAARNRVEQRFDLGKIVERYQELYRDVLALPGPSSAQQSSVASLVG
jgi:glycosyltransferase involved in cell wall biosynthesis